MINVFNPEFSRLLSQMPGFILVLCQGFLMGGAQAAFLYSHQKWWLWIVTHLLAGTMQMLTVFTLPAVIQSAAAEVLLNKIFINL